MLVSLVADQDFARVDRDSWAETPVRITRRCRISLQFRGLAAFPLWPLSPP